MRIPADSLLGACSSVSGTHPGSAIRGMHKIVDNLQRHQNLLQQYKSLTKEYALHCFFTVQSILSFL